jgi:hypothetical protein
VSVLIGDLQTPADNCDRVLEVRRKMASREVRLAKHLGFGNAFDSPRDEYIGLRTAFRFPPHAI